MSAKDEKAEGASNADKEMQGAAAADKEAEGDATLDKEAKAASRCKREDRERVRLAPALGLQIDHDLLFPIQPKQRMVNLM